MQCVEVYLIRTSKIEKYERTRLKELDFQKNIVSCVFPVLIDQDDDYYKMIFRKTNGLLIPGGAANILDSGNLKSCECVL